MWWDHVPTHQHHFWRTTGDHAGATAVPPTCEWHTVCNRPRNHVRFAYLLMMPSLAEQSVTSRINNYYRKTWSTYRSGQAPGAWCLMHLYAICCTSTRRRTCRCIFTISVGPSFLASLARNTWEFTYGRTSSGTFTLTRWHPRLPRGLGSYGKTCGMYQGSAGGWRTDHWSAPAWNMPQWYGPIHKSQLRQTGTNPATDNPIGLLSVLILDERHSPC